MNLREAAQKALTALEHHAMQRTYAGGVYISNAAIALRAALAQKQEPVAWQAVGGSIWGHKTSEDDRPLYTEGSWNEGYKHGQWQAKHCAALAQPVPAMNNGDPDISRILNDNLASLYIEDEPAAQPAPNALPVAYMMVNKNHRLSPQLQLTPPIDWHPSWEAVPLYAAPEAP
jgi:hypothetical protein